MQVKLATYTNILLVVAVKYLCSMKIIHVKYT